MCRYVWVGCHTFGVVDEAQVRSVVERHIGVQPGVVRDVSGGFGHSTFVVDDMWVFRFARDEAVAERDHLEHSTLPLVASAVTFRVPVFEHTGFVDGLPYVGYRLIPGRHLQPGDVPALVSPIDLGRAIHELHSINTSRLSVVLGVEADGSAWTDRYAHLQRRARLELSGVLDQSQLDAVDKAFTRFFAAPLGFDPVVVHGDLGTSHILVDDTGLVGMIDFEAASIGDPAVDFVGLLITLGPDTCRSVIEAYPGRVDSGFWERLVGYYWIGSLYAVFHGVTTRNQSITKDGVQGLTERLAQITSL